MMRFSLILPIVFSLFPGCRAFVFKDQEGGVRSLIARATSAPHRRQENEVYNDNNIQTANVYCEQGAVNDGSATETCTCNTFEDGVVELSCLENCIYCGDTESSSCGQFSYATNLTDGLTSNTISHTTRFQYNGTGGRYDLISVEEIDCTTDIGECSSCRVLVNGTVCNSCTLCSGGVTVDCENIVTGSSFNTCSSPPGPGLFEGFAYDVVECAVPPPPANDNCTSAIPIVPGDVVSGTLTGALEDAVPFCDYEGGTQGVWYSFQGTGTPVLASTCSGSITDSGVGLIAVYKGSGCDLLECSAGSYQESYCPGYSGGSSMLVPTEVDTTYYIYVSGWFGSFGTFDLSLTKFVEHGNDECSVASEISIDGGPVAGAVEFVPGGQLAVCGSERVEPFGDAWYHFVAAADGTLRASTCSSSTIGWMSTIAIASGDCDALSCVEQSDTYSSYETCNEGDTFVDFQVVAGTSYYVALWGGGYGDVGLFELDIRSLNPPANDNCENAQSVDVTATLTGTFSDVTVSSDESDEICLSLLGSSNSGGIWYSFVGTGDIVIATACSNDFTPYVTMYTGSCGDLQCESPATWYDPSICSNFLHGQQSVPFETEAGALYYVLVSGSGPISGNFDLSIRTVPRVENDSCMDAVQIQADGQLIIGNTEGALYEGFNNGCQYSSRSPGVWYAVVGNGGMLRADTCSEVTNFDTVISVYSGSCEDLQCVGANDDGCESVSSSITWLSEEGVTYFVRVSGLNDGQTGDYGFKVVSFVPAVNDGCDGAIALPIGGTLSGTMEGATSSSDYPCYTGYERPSLWYYLDGTGTALKVSTCSPNTTFNGGMQAFGGTTCSDLECVGLSFEVGSYADFDCPYPSAATWFLAEAGLRYYILVIDGSLDGADSTFTLNVTEFEIAANDVCETAIPIAVSDNEVVEGSTIRSLPDNITCYEYSSYAPGVWYSVTGTGNILVASTCSSLLNFESSIFVFSGGCGDLECVAVGMSSAYPCSESIYGGSRASFRTEVGVQYYILVTGSYSTALGDFALSFTETVPPPNDVCLDATEISPNTGTILGSLAGATSFLGSNYSCAWDRSADSVWYSLIGTGDVISISTCSSQLNFDSAISVSTGTCDNHVCVTTNAFNGGYCSETSFASARATFRSEAGVKYFVAVERLNYATEGEFGLTVTTLQVPGNDECPGAIVIQPDAGTISGSITNSTGSTDPNVTLCASYDVPDVWYSMVGTGEVFAVSTCSSVLNFDSSIMVFTGPCDLLECAAYVTDGNNDCPESSFSASRAVFRTQAGSEYFILVQSRNYQMEGDFVLQLSRLEAPPNDECSGAIAIQESDTILRGSLANATGSAGFDNSCEYSFQAPSIWYSLIGTGDIYAISTCSSELSFDSALSISSGSCDDQVCVLSTAYNDYDCTESTFASTKAVFRTEVGVEYFIQVQSLSSSSPLGEFALQVSTVVGPANDVCTSAQTITAGTVAGSITNATGSTAYATSCSYNYDAPDVWYTLVGTGDAYAVSTCSSVTNFDAALSVSTGSCDDQECITSGAQNEVCGVSLVSAAKVVFRTEPGVEYFISVQSVNYETSGDFELQISTIELPPNDICSGALTIVPGDDPIFGSTSDASNTVTNSSCSGPDTSPDLWYRVEGTGSTLTASTCGDITTYDSQLTIYEGDGNDCATTCIVSSDDFCGTASQVQWESTVGVTYYIRVHGYASSSGSFVLTVT